MRRKCKQKENADWEREREEKVYNCFLTEEPVNQQPEKV